MLIGQFWGTSAAEGVPAPYCRCPVCEEARQVGDRAVRMRSSFRLSDKIMIDLGADAVAQSMKYGCISDVEHILVTHTHDDHLNPHMMLETVWSATSNTTRNYYFTEDAYDIVDHWRNSNWILKGGVPELESRGLVAFHKLSYNTEYSVGDVTVVPFRGNHVGNVKENSALYLVKLPNGKTLFYGLDSGEYFEETLDALKKYRIDIFITEATGGIHDISGYKYHMDIYKAKRLVDTLMEQGTLTRDSQVYLTHINHSSSYFQMLREVGNIRFPIPVTVAFDGLKIF